MKVYRNLGEADKARNEVTALKISVRSEAFPQDILNFPNLEQLYLEGNCRSFPIFPPGWIQLKVLSIKWPDFDGDLSPIFKLPNLENLKILETPLDTFILPLGHTASPLKSLTVKNCSLNSLPEEIGMLSALQEMNLSGNHLKELPESFIELKKLKRLNLDYNHFEKFPEVIKNMKKLSHLSIDHNLFSEEEKEKIQREFHIWPA